MSKFFLHLAGSRIEYWFPQRHKGREELSILGYHLVIFAGHIYLVKLMGYLTFIV
jgi:hypothetical protein